MKIGRSFQLYVALWVAGFAAILWVVGGLVTWWLVWRQFVTSVDARLLPVAGRVYHQAGGPQPVDAGNLERQWQRNLPQDIDPNEFLCSVWQREGEERLFSTPEGEWVEWEFVMSHLSDDLGPAQAYGSKGEAFGPKGGPPGGKGARPGKGEKGDPFFPPPMGEIPMPPGVSSQGEGAQRPFFPPLPRGPRVVPHHAPPEYASLTSPSGQSWRFAVVAGPYAAVVHGVRIKAYARELYSVRRRFVLFGLLGLGFVASGSWWMANRALIPLRRIGDTLASITGPGEGRRVSQVQGGFEEFDALVGTINAMMGRLEQSFQQATRFTADASHELRTPIALLQAEVDTSLKRGPQSPEEQLASNQHLAEEIQRLKRITEGLLLLSRVDSGEITKEKTGVRWSEEMESLCEDVELICMDSGYPFEGSVTPDLHVAGDRVLLLQAAQNLIQNALKYNGPEGRVTVTLSEEGGQACLRVMNEGPGIPKEHQEKIFDRFYRAESARSRQIDGVGLGLNLTREIARIHQGEVELVSSTEEGGTTFRLCLPLAERGEAGSSVHGGET
ncbi:MAG: ATP-binding protein [Verrucomicrobiota bacterium]